MDNKEKQFLNSQKKFYKVDQNSQNPWTDSKLIYLNRFHIPHMQDILKILDKAVRTVKSKKQEDFKKYYEGIRVFWNSQYDDTMEYWKWFHEGKSMEETKINFISLAEMIEITKKAIPGFDIMKLPKVTKSKI